MNNLVEKFHKGYYFSKLKRKKAENKSFMVSFIWIHCL